MGGKGSFILPDGAIVEYEVFVLLLFMDEHNTLTVKISLHVLLTD